MDKDEMKQIAAFLDQVDANTRQINDELKRRREEKLAQFRGEKNGHHSSTWEDLKLFISPIKWDWSGWLPRGFLTILASEPGMGKSLLCLRLAACYLSGLDWPDGRPFQAEPGKVIWCEGEASQALNLTRALAWDLNLSDIISPLPHPLEGFRLDDVDHMVALLHFCKQPETRLVIMDSLSSLVVGGPTTSGKPNKSVQGIPRVLRQLGEISRLTKTPILLTHHLRKRTSLDYNGLVDLQRLRGTSKIGQLARVVWTLDAPDTADEQYKRLAVVKNNLMPLPAPVGMRIGKEGLTFGDPPVPTVEIGPASQLDLAAQFLLEHLQQGPVPFPEIAQAAQQNGLPLPTLRRAKKRLNIRSQRLPGHTAWSWSLPPPKPKSLPNPPFPPK